MHTQTRTRTNTNTQRRGPTGWQIHINILLIPPIMISQQLFVLEWMINLLTPTLYFIAGLQCVYFLKNTLSQKSIICEMKSIRRSPWWDTQIILIEINSIRRSPWWDPQIILIEIKSIWRSPWWDTQIILIEIKSIRRSPWWDTQIILIEIKWIRRSPWWDTDYSDRNSTNEQNKTTHIHETQN